MPFGPGPSPCLPVPSTRGGALPAPSDSLELVGKAVVVGADPGACRFLPKTYQVLQPLGEAQKLFRPAGRQQGRLRRGQEEGVRRAEPCPRATAPSPSFPLPVRTDKTKAPPRSLPQRGPSRGAQRWCLPQLLNAGCLPYCHPNTYPPTPRPAARSLQGLRFQLPGPPQPWTSKPGGVCRGGGALYQPPQAPRCPIAPTVPPTPLPHWSGLGIWCPHKPCLQ